MHELFSAPARPELRGYVRAFAQRKLNQGDAEGVQPVPACLEHTIEFEFGDYPIVEFGDGTLGQSYETVVVGPGIYRRANIRLRAGLESFAIFFQPLAFWQLFKIPVAEFINRHYDGCDVIGPEIKQLRDRMAEAASFSGRVQLVEEFLLEKAADSMANTRVMNAARYIFETQGATRVRHVAEQASLGLRQFERVFSAEVGVSPKLYARVARFQAALDAKVSGQNVPWLHLAHRFGYQDQMHMIRDFQNLSGLTPKGLYDCLGDMRPPALATSPYGGS